MACVVVVSVGIGWMLDYFSSANKRYRKVLEWTGDKRFANIAITYYSFQSHSIRVSALIDGKVRKYDSLQTFIDYYASVTKGNVDPTLIPYYWFIRVKVGDAAYVSPCTCAELRNSFDWNATERSNDRIYVVELRDRNLGGEPIRIAGSENARANKILSIVSTCRNMTEFKTRDTLDRISKMIHRNKTVEDLDPVAQSMFAVVNEACNNKPIQIDATDD